jgi:hypothetical protein
MSEFRFSEIVFGWPEKIVNGTFIWIWNADKIPPHIGISRGQNYFSLTYRNCEIQKSVTSMVRKAKRSGVPLVMVDISDWEIKQDFTTVFQQFEKARAGGPTCLSPVKATLGMGDEIRQLSDLLTEIKRCGKMKQVFALHLGPAYQGIPDYSVSEIMSRIEHLHEINRSESTAPSS